MQGVQYGTATENQVVAVFYLGHQKAVLTTMLNAAWDRSAPARECSSVLNAFAVDAERDVAPQHRQQAAAAVNWPARIMLVDQAEQQPVLFALEDRRVIVARSR
jgi:hypothetical protein